MIGLDWIALLPAIASAVWGGGCDWRCLFVCLLSNVVVDGDYIIVFFEKNERMDQSKKKSRIDDWWNLE